MKTTRYFEAIRQRANRRCIREEWIQRAIIDPAARQRQADGRIRQWA